MYDYLISTEFNKGIFEQQCAALESKIPGIIKGDRLHDVDDSECQHYELDGTDIKVSNSAYTNDVSVTSEVDLLPYFN